MTPKDLQKAVSSLIRSLPRRYNKRRMITIPIKPPPAADKPPEPLIEYVVETPPPPKKPSVAYLIDHENTGYRWTLYDYPKDSVIYLMTGLASEKAVSEQTEKIKSEGPNVCVVRCEVGGKNALDMQLSFALGFILNDNKSGEKGGEAEAYAIMSNDGDFRWAKSIATRILGAAVWRVNVPEYDIRQAMKNWDGDIPGLPYGVHNPILMRIVAESLDTAYFKEYKKKRADHIIDRKNTFRQRMQYHRVSESAISAIYKLLDDAGVFEKYFHRTGAD